MFILDEYRLELHWDGVDKNKDDSCNLYGTYFSGPVISRAEKINPGDNITLDFTPQYSRIITSYYFVKLLWGQLEYKDEKVILQDVVMRGEFVNRVSNLKDSDYIIIDTSQHDGNKHLYSLVYRASVINESGEEYC